VNAMPFPQASRVGFGCASLGSRVGVKPGLIALSRAFDRGVNWFDLAPSYGDGHAEEIFANFSRSRRSEIHICTKCGIMAPRRGAVAAAIRPLARSIVTHAPRLRKALASRRSAATRMPLTGDLITSSIERSLKRLHTDYVDVLALHDPDSHDLARDDVRSALESVVANGFARAAGIAGSRDAIQTALRLKLPIRLVQIANDPLDPKGDTLARLLRPWREPIFVATHSAFGPPDLVRRLVAIVRSDHELQHMLQRIGYELPYENAVRAALIDYALQCNPAGTVLFSMFSVEHLAYNVGRANLSIRADPQSFFTAIYARFANANNSG